MKLNSHCLWRIELAKEISSLICTIPGVKAIIIGGSVARGYADPYSDLEIPIFWERLPSMAVRKSIVAGLNAEFLIPFNGPAREDNITIEGFQIDLWHNTVIFEETVFHSVLKNFDDDLGSSNFLDTIRVCIPLFGEEIIDRWKEKARQYPRELAVKNIDENVMKLEWANPDLLVRRNNPTLIYDWIIGQQKWIFLILLALNQQYFPTYKWMVQTMELMPLKPRDTVKRFQEAFRCPVQEAIEDTNQMIDETLGLIATYFPEINLDAPKQQLLKARKAFEHAVIFKPVE